MIKIKSFSSIIVAILCFILIISIKSLYIDFLILILNCDNSFIESAIRELNINYLQNFYPRYPFVAFFLIFNIKFIKLYLIAFIFIIFHLIYKKRIINKELLFTSLLTLILLLVFEFGLGIVDYKSIIGLKFNDREIGSNLILDQLLGVDQAGINYFLKKAELSDPSYQINNQGFRSPYDFDSINIQSLKDTSTLVMFIGDSHTEGCCASPIQKSFVDIIDSKKGISALNFGVGGTDPLQYKLIADKYLAQINPDILIIPFCLGNDFMDMERKPNKDLPLHFQTNFDWLDTRLPISHPNYFPDSYFSNWEEAKSFYLENYCIIGENPNFIERYIIEPSNLMSFLYFIPKSIKKIILVNINKLSKQFPKIKEKEFISYNYIKSIKRTADSLNIKFILVGIPTIRDMDNNLNIKNIEYQNLMQDIPLKIPNNIEKEDFVSYANDHFNNSGHQKFADFLDSLILITK